MGWIGGGSSGAVASVFTRTGAVVAANGDYLGVLAAAKTGATAAFRLAGATASGAPASGTWAVGDLIVDQTGFLWVCTVAGTPGTWVQIGVKPAQQYLGYNTAGGSVSNPGVGTYNTAAKQITFPSNGFIATIDAYFKGDGSHLPPCWAAILSDNSNAPNLVLGGFGVESTLAAAIAGLNLGTTQRWLSIPCGYYAASGTKVWLAIIYGNGGQLAFDGSGSDYAAATGTAAQDGGLSSGSNKFSIRASFIPTA